MTLMIDHRKVIYMASSFADKARRERERCLVWTSYVPIRDIKKMSFDLEPINMHFVILNIFL